uniref:Uncharacterized protein n=1 Tax=Oryza barthii TaxID=65489 RepID=A0A0D3HVA7_9ORYZ
MAKSILLCCSLIGTPRRAQACGDGRMGAAHAANLPHTSTGAVLLLASYKMAMRMPLQTAVVTDICRQGGLENLQHFVGSTLICFIGVVLLVGFVHA